MKKPIFTILLFMFSLTGLQAGPGDTIIVQTIDFNTPVMPGWNAPRSGKYLFPPDSIKFSKILLSYTLKCDPDQNPHCGEWDYTTHIKYIEHTGRYDSNLYYNPNYLVNNVSPDSFPYMNDTSWNYFPVLEYFNNTPPSNEAEVSDGTSHMSLPFGINSGDGRFQAVYSASDLLEAGVKPGQITGIKLFVSSGKTYLKHFMLRIKNHDGNSDSDTLINAGLTNVYCRNTVLDTGWNDLRFAFPFEWDGTSGLLFDFSYVSHWGTAQIKADTVDTNMAASIKEKDFFLDFEGWDYLTVPPEVFSTVDSCITISFWQYGNPEIQPSKSSVFEAVDSAGNRVLNVHLPWVDEKIYWDAGRDNTGQDRISRVAHNTGEWEGKWNHWVFMKNAHGSGLMQIFHNGVLWFQQSGKHKLIKNIEKFRIGAAIRYNGYYAGMIDEFRIWDTVLDWDVLKEYMYKDVDTTHPYYKHLRAYYKFNEGKGTSVTDNSPNGFDASQFGLPQWLGYNGKNRFRNSVAENHRPHLVFENGDYDSTLLSSSITVDTVAKEALNIVVYDSSAPQTPRDTLLKWPHYYNYTFDNNGHAVDSTLIPYDGIFYHNDLPYYGKPYEIKIPWEIGRFITPYGIGLDLGDGFTWMYDVTDYAPFLHDSVHLTAGNFQELLDMKFIMIEGEPPRDVKKIEKVYSGYYGLKNFSENVPPDTIALLPGADAFKLKVRTSGHQFSNPDNCAEFCYRIHSIDINNREVAQWQIIQECATNPLYPQGGTWIYDRAGWCPGMKVTEREFDITPYIDGDTVIIDYNSQPSQWGAYSLVMHLISYGKPNFNVDAAVDEIIAPNKLKRYGRDNPTATNPVIVIQNRGGDTLKSVDIIYGPLNTSPKTFHWTGSLPILAKEEIKLESFSRNEWQGAGGIFYVKLENPNNTDDENTINDMMTSRFELPPVFPSTIIINFKTNKTAYQNSYEIFDRYGNIVYQKDDFENNTIYNDTVTLLNGAYDFYLWDSGDNGISFWANNEGSGSLKFYNINGDLIKYFNGDFGSFIYQSFFADSTLSVNEYGSNQTAFNIIPNPNSGIFTLSYASKTGGKAKIYVIDILGKTIFTKDVILSKNGNINLKITGLHSGIYSLILEKEGIRITKKLIIKSR
jgi:hypothetical protein